MVNHRQLDWLKFNTHYSFQTQTSERLSPNTKLHCVETSAVINQGARSSAGLQTLHTLAINLPPQFIKTPAVRCQPAYPLCTRSTSLLNVILLSKVSYDKDLISKMIKTSTVIKTRWCLSVCLSWDHAKTIMDQFNWHFSRNVWYNSTQE